MTIPSLDLTLGAVDPRAVAFTPAEGLSVAQVMPQAVPQTSPQSVLQTVPQPVQQLVPQPVQQTALKSASALDPVAVARFREVLDAPLADNARLQGQLARAVAYVATASTAIESAGALPVVGVSAERQSAMPQTELGPAPAPANVAPNPQPAVELVVRDGAPITAERPVVERPVVERPVVEKLVEPSAPNEVVRGDVPEVARADVKTSDVFRLPAVGVSAERQSAMPQTELGPAPAPANVAPNTQPAVELVVRDGAPITAERPVVERPAVERPAVERPVVERPVVERPVVERPAVERPVVERPVVERPVVRDDDSEDVVLQALPQGTAVQAEVSSPVRESAPVVAPVATEQVARAEAAEMQMLVAAANEVADAILVSPGLLRGQGEILVRLKPDVLSGTEIRIETTGRTLSVEFQPTVQDVAALIERNLPGLQERLAMNIAAFDVAVSVRANVLAGRGRVRKTEEDA